MSLKQSKTFSTRLKLCASAFLLFSPMVGLTACSHHDEPNFAPLTYDYLTPIFFNVGQITIQNMTAGATYPRDVTNLSPVSPITALENMANNRFKARGSARHAVFTIKRASLQESGHNGIYGQMDVSFDIYNSNNQKMASIQAGVNHTYDIDSSKGDANSKSNLYDITQKLMQDMNVELEYQIRQHLQKYIVDATGTPIANDIQTQDLGTPNKPTSTQKNTKAKQNTGSTDEDLSAVFPGGRPDSGSKTSGTQQVPETTSKYPTGSLGTIPASAVPDGY
ncbi:hypothetical protein [Commensalibacter oyaizuii]|uniref:Lipoprotein n=1 Tax=Commensalibacter oyaizuii TaxID=3043873 RepID=A0ABT6Q098_9PROT|nr:hypothetical protein [Commensalibacter sp. TBRC 16381]MDI2090545.1 hypothetical protein [Commensalibacter sp. TBRC 16381]